MTHHERYRSSAGPQTTRAVWAAVTRDPCASMDDMAAKLGIARSTVYHALQRLRDLGYISFQDRAKVSRTVLVPCRVGPLGLVPALLAILEAAELVRQPVDRLVQRGDDPVVRREGCDCADHVRYSFYVLIWVETGRTRPARRLRDLRAGRGFFRDDKRSPHGSAR